ncbi:hypothetical protein Tco_1412198, partial [Tanacetum coccineum]
DSPFDLVAYTDNDYTGASLDRKSTTRGCQFLGCRLISWQCKKQTVVDNSTTEAEYIAASNCCRHVLWIQNQLLDYGYNFMKTKIHIDNESTICIVKNPVFHSKTKHIKIRHHFIKDSNEKKLIQDTVKAKTVNGEVQLQALVDKKKVIITESTIRRDLQLEDANGVDCLPNAVIFEQLALMGKDTKIPQSSGPTKHIADEVANEENVPTQSNDPPLSRVNTFGSGEDRLSLKELMDLCTKLSDRVLDLETTKTAQDSEIASLKKKVKKLERRNKSRTPGLKRLRKVGSARRVESSDEASLGNQEDASKQGRKIDIDADAEVTLIDETQGRNYDNLMFDIGVLDEQDVEVEKIKAAKPKVRGVMIQESSEFTTTATTTPAASTPSQDNGKAKMIKRLL